MEIALYPEDGGRFFVRREQFRLVPRLAGDLVREEGTMPADPATVAGVLARESGTGQEEWGVAAIVAQGSGDGAGAGAILAPEKTGNRIENPVEELAAKSLPEGELANPVAGFLYFPFAGPSRNLPRWSVEYCETADLCQRVELGTVRWVAPRAVGRGR